MTARWPFGVGAGLALALIVQAVPLFTIWAGGSGALPAALPDQPLGCSSCDARHQHLTRLAPSSEKKLAP